MTHRPSRGDVLMIATMTSGFVAYVAFHSPIRAAIAAAGGRTVHSAYFAAVSGFSADSLSAIAAIALAAGAAGLITRRFDGARFERPIAFGIYTTALVVVPAGIVGGLAGATGRHLLRPPLGPLLTAIPSAVLCASAIRWKRVAAGNAFRMPLGRGDRAGANGIAIWFIAIAAALISASVTVALTLPPAGFDALSYHAPMAIYLWRDGNLISYLDRAPGGFALAQPGAAELWFGLWQIAGGEHFASIGQLPFALLAAAAVNAFSRRLGFAAAASRLAACSFLLAPLVVMQVGMQLNDVAAAAFLMAAAALALARAGSWTLWRAIAIGLALAVAVTMKLAVVPAAAAVGLFTVWRLAAGDRRLARSATAVALAAAFAIGVAPWWIRNATRFGNPLYPQALPIVGRGVVVGDFQKKDAHFVPSKAAWLVYPLVEPVNDQSGLGPLFVAGAIPGLAALLWRRRRAAGMLFLMIAVFTLPPWWTLTQHEPRHLLVLFGLGFAFVPASILIVPRRARGAACAVLGAAALFSGVLTLDQGLAPRLRQPHDRAEYYDVVWGVDPAVANQPSAEPLLYNLGYASLSYAGDYALLGASLGRELLTIEPTTSTTEIVRLMRRFGVNRAYVPASPAAQPTVRARYPEDLFELEHVSRIGTGDRAGTERYLYRLRDAPALANRGSDPDRAYALVSTR